RPRNLAEALMLGDEEAVDAFKRAAQFEQGLRGGGSRNTEMTPAQVLSVHRQASQQAQMELREGLISVEDVPTRLDEIKYELLAELGAETGPPPPSLAEIRAQRRVRGRDIRLPGPGTGAPPAAPQGAPPMPAAPPAAPAQDVPPPRSFEEIPAWLAAQGAPPTEANIRAAAERFNLAPAPSQTVVAPLTGRQR